MPRIGLCPIFLSVVHLPAMASSRRRQSTITDHFSSGAYQSNSTTPLVTSRRATTTPDTFTGFRTSSPPPTPITIYSHHGDLNRSHHGSGGLDHSSIGIDKSPLGIEVHTTASSLTLARSHHGCSTSHHGGTSHHDDTSHQGGTSHHGDASLDGCSSQQGGHRSIHPHHPLTP
jgi:hypothetical protein